MNDRFLSTQFQHELIFSYHFLLNINQSTWSWSIVERQTHIAIAGSQRIYRSLDDIEEELKQWPLSAFGKVSILFFSEGNVLVPSSFFDQSDKKVLLQFCVDLPQDTCIEVNAVDETEMINLFSISDELHRLKERILPQAVSFHGSTPFILAAHQLSQQLFYPVISMGIYPETICIAIADGGKVLFSNYFKATTQEDMLYWLMRLVEQLELDGSKITIYIHGSQPLASERMNYLTSYFNKVLTLPFPACMAIAKDAPEGFFQPFIDSFYLVCE